MRIPTILFVALLALPGPAFGEMESPMINVWPGLAPGETTTATGIVSSDHSGNVTRLTDITSAQLLLFPAAERGIRPTVLVCPGGGYSILAADLEGTEVAKWLNGRGFTAAVLHYRVPNKREGAFQDVQRAMSTLRARAAEWNIDPNHLGILVFSSFVV